MAEVVTKKDDGWFNSDVVVSGLDLIGDIWGKDNSSTTVNYPTATPTKTNYTPIILTAVGVVIVGVVIAVWLRKRK